MTTATAAQDVVAVLGPGLGQVFERARTIKASIGRESKVMEHPLETGASVVDHRIVLPVSIELSMILASEDYQAVYQQVRDLFLRGDLLTVQTRVDSFPSMLIEKMPHEEGPDIYDGVAMGLTLREALFVQPQFSSLRVREPRDSDTVPRGQQQPNEAPPERRASILSGIF